jgi:hypothetical protein
MRLLGIAGECETMINLNVPVITEDIRLHQYLIRIVDPEMTKLCFKTGNLVNIKISKPETPGTDRQNKAAHALLTAYYITGLHSMPEGTPEDFKNYMKCQYGVKYEVEIKGQKYTVLKSWADYSREERMTFIDGLISEIHQSGAYAESEKIREIINGFKQEEQLCRT